MNAGQGLEERLTGETPVATKNRENVGKVCLATGMTALILRQVQFSNERRPCTSKLMEISSSL